MVALVRAHVGCREGSSGADEETVSKPCYARLVVNGTAADAGVEPEE